MPAPYYDDDEQVTEACEFPYAEVDAHLASEAIEDADYIDPGDLGKARVFYKLLEWLWQVEPKNRSGLEIRATIVCWIFLKWLQPCSLTEMAANTHHVCHRCQKPITRCPKCGAPFDRHKQALGRWVDNFKDRFPNIKTQNIKQ